MEDKTVAVGSKHKGNVKQPGVIQPLLHPFADGVLIGFCLDHRQWQVWLVVENDIGGFDFDTGSQFSAHHDLTIPEFHFLPNL